MTGGRVAVTGLGCITASGHSTEDLLGAIRTGESGVTIEGDDSFAWSLGDAPVDFEGRVSRLALRRLDDSMKRALHAALQAVDQTGFDITEHSTALGVVVATGFAGTASCHALVRTIWEYGPEGADPSLFPNTVSNGPAGQLAIHLKARGPGTNFFDADTCGECALRYARREILAGHADAILVCGVDERAEAVIAIEELYRRARVRRAPNGLLRPFDSARTGTVLGQASTAVLLESEESAGTRGVEPLAFLGPVALGAESSPPGAWPERPEVLVRCALQAVRNADVPVDDIAFLNSSARGSRAFDAYEAAAIGQIGDEIGARVPVTAPMSYSGSLSTSGIFRLAVSVLGLREAMVPATSRLVEADSSLGVHVSASSRPAVGRSALQLGAGAGGATAAFVVSLP